MFNNITALGHLVQDPTTRQTSTGKSITTFRICVSDNNAKNKCFIDVETWEKTADVCAQYLTKGREVLINGELCLSSWEKDGAKFSKHFIKGDRVKFLGGGKKEGDTPTGQSKASSNAQQGDDLDEVPF